jgi:hypothetical protein
LALKRFFHTKNGHFALFGTKYENLTQNGARVFCYLDRVALFTPVQTEIEKGQATRVRRKTPAFLSKRREKENAHFAKTGSGQTHKKR